MGQTDRRLRPEIRASRKRVKGAIALLKWFGSMPDDLAGSRAAEAMWETVETAVRDLGLTARERLLAGADCLDDYDVLDPDGGSDRHPVSGPNGYIGWVIRADKRTKWKALAKDGIRTRTCHTQNNAIQWLIDQMTAEETNGD